MNKKGKKLVYEPPLVIDMSEFISASGQVISPMGDCRSGIAPFYSCVNGPDFLGVCEAGTTPDTSWCEVGTNHLVASCDYGTVATTTCMSGGGQQ